MFTGIVEGVTKIAATEPQGDGIRITVRLPHDDLALGESVSIDGACLTVAALDPVQDGGQLARFDISPESLAKTVAGKYAPGRPVNYERALRMSDRVGGHWVTGHVDSQGLIASVRENADGSRVLGIRAIQGGAPFLFDKGSVSIQGVSLTIVDPAVEAEGAAFSAWLVPHTLECTTLRTLAEGDTVNVEFDWMAKALWNFEKQRATQPPRSLP